MNYDGAWTTFQISFCRFQFTVHTRFTYQLSSIYVAASHKTLPEHAFSIGAKLLLTNPIKNQAKDFEKI